MVWSTPTLRRPARRAHDRAAPSPLRRHSLETNRTGSTEVANGRPCFSSHAVVPVSTHETPAQDEKRQPAATVTDCSIHHRRAVSPVFAWLLLSDKGSRAGTPDHLARRQAHRTGAIAASPKESSVPRPSRSRKQSFARCAVSAHWGALVRGGEMHVLRAKQEPAGCATRRLPLLSCGSAVGIRVDSLSA
jgi:hypothetical protein